MTIITIVARRSSDNAIGSNGKIPWYVPEDLSFFSKSTKKSSNTEYKNVCIMGRITYKTLGRLTLPNRIIYVVTRNVNFEVEEGYEDSVKIFNCPLEALNAAKNSQCEKIFICGGDTIYRQLVRYSDFIYLSEIHYDNQAVGDAFFSQELLSNFEIIDSYPIMYSKNNKIPYTHDIYRMIRQENRYTDIAKLIINEGEIKDDRTGIGTISVFGTSIEFDVSGDSFPLLTTKRVYWKGVVSELLWFIKGDTNANRLSNDGVKIWDGNTSREFLDKRGLTDYEIGDIGPGYGFQWRHWGADYKGMNFDYRGLGRDQLVNAIDQIINNPSSRRIIVSAWNVEDIDSMALPPCHLLYQFNVRGKENDILDIQVYQRSADWFLGVPFNIASYSLLLMIICKLTNKKPGKMRLVFGDTHIYSNHLEQIKLQIKRCPRKFPSLHIKDKGQTKPEDFEIEDFVLKDYNPHPAIKADMAV